MELKLNRREMLWTATTGIGAMAGSMIWGRASASPAAAGSTDASKWKYHQLNPQITADMGYAGYYKGHCCYGAFYSIVGQLAEHHGTPYNSFPFWMMEFGTGGIGLYGTVCGALNGAAAAIGLFSHGPDQNALITDLFTWYEQKALPMYQPGKPIYEARLHQSTSQSVLCHRSVGQWCNAVKPSVPIKSEARAERCARLVGDVSHKTAELLNSSASGRWKPSTLAEETESCMACHSIGPSEKDSIVRMECGTCHDDLAPDHGQK